MAAHLALVSLPCMPSSTWFNTRVWRAIIGVPR